MPQSPAEIAAILERTRSGLPTTFALATPPRPAPRPAAPAARTRPSAPKAAAPDGTTARRLRLAVHESAHALWAALSGAQITRCVVSENGDDGAVEIAEESPVSAEIAYAGIWATARFDLHGMRRGDRALSRGEIEAALRDASPEDREKFSGFVRPLRHLEPDLERVLPQIHGLAVHLCRNGSAAHADVERILGVREGLTAAAIRSLVRQGVDLRTVTPAGVAA